MSELSVQLYTLRKPLEQDFDGTLQKLAGFGFTQVEPFQLPAFADQLRTGLRESGLAAPTTHVGILNGNQDEICQLASDLGIQTIIEPYVDPARWEAEADITEIASELNAAAKTAAGYGLRVGYHNHHWELASRLGGRPALERLAERLPPAVVLELDTYWAAVGGEDVPALLGRLGDRVRLLHLKDGPIDQDKAAQLPLGAGAMPVAAILEAATAAELAVLEFDDYAGDLFDGLAAGRAFANGLGLR